MPKVEAKERDDILNPGIFKAAVEKVAANNNSMKT